MYADAILFDLDGTLWDSVDEIILTWNSVIEKHPGVRPPITRSEQEGVMGLQMDVIARRLFPGFPFETQRSLMQECVQAENKYLYSHGGILYDGVEETLRELGKTHKLCIVSNCQKGYIEAFLHAHDLSRYFYDTICFGQTGKSKGENNLEIIRRNGFTAPVYVGDTQGDKNSAVHAGIPFVFAAYGFGSVDSYDEKADSFRALADIFR